MKQAIKRALGEVCGTLRIGQATARLRPGRFAILMFHRVVDAATFKDSANKPLMVEEGIFSRMAETLAQECLCLPLAEAVENARTGKAHSKPIVAITFDDGYADGYHKAYPVLARFNLPATIYLSTGYLDDPERIFWWDAVEGFFSNPVNLAELLESDLPKEFLDEVLDLARSPSAGRVENFIRGPMYRLDPENRRNFLNLIRNSPLPKPAMLSWGQVREMASSGLVDFGAHTVNHPLLDEVEPKSAVSEVLVSRERVEAETGRSVTSFAYPSGRVPTGHQEILSRSGIGLAVTTRYGGNDAKSHPLLLRRIDARLGLVGGEFIPSYFKSLCWGCFDWLY